MQYKTRANRIFHFVNIFILAVVSLLCVLPFINLLAISFSDSAAVAAGAVGFTPVDFTLSAYEYALKGGKFIRALFISFERVFLGVGLNLILMVLTAYPLSKTRKKVAGRNIYMVYFVITMLVSGGMIPTYLVVTGLGLKDTIWALILPGRSGIQYGHFNEFYAWNSGGDRRGGRNRRSKSIPDPDACSAADPETGVGNGGAFLYRHTLERLVQWDDLYEQPGQLSASDISAVFASEF